MKMTANELSRPLTKKRAKREPDPESFTQKCKRAGVDTGTISGRMRRYGLTFEEALKWVPEDASTLSRRSSLNSPWRETTPASPADIARSQKP